MCFTPFTHLYRYDGRNLPEALQDAASPLLNPQDYGGCNRPDVSITADPQDPGDVELT